VFLNKLDRPGASFNASLASLLAHRFHPKPMALTLPVASFNPVHYSTAEPGIQGLVDLVKWELWAWNLDGRSTRYPLPRNVQDLSCMDIIPAGHPIVPHLLPARSAFLENLSMHSEDLMESLLNLPSDPSAYLQVEATAILPHLRTATIRNHILPVLCGSAIKNIGTELVMDYVGELLASPIDVNTNVVTNNGSVQLLAWKVGWDPRRGWMTFVRVYSGSFFGTTMSA
jgi:elongation factor G